MIVLNPVRCYQWGWRFRSKNDARIIDR